MSCCRGEDLYKNEFLAGDIVFFIFISPAKGILLKIAHGQTGDVKKDTGRVVPQPQMKGKICPAAEDMKEKEGNRE